MFTLASPVRIIKMVSKDIASIFKLFYEKVERYHTEVGRYHQDLLDYPE